MKIDRYELNTLGSFRLAVFYCHFAGLVRRSNGTRLFSSAMDGKTFEVLLLSVKKRKTKTLVCGLT